METDYDKELLMKLKTEIAENKINIHNNIDDFINEIEINYPMGFSGIDWTEKKPVFFVNFYDQNELLEKITYQFSKILNIFPELLNEKIIIFGDGLTNLGYEMIFDDFIKLNRNFLTIPQHTYIWFTDSKKCMNITFEDELFFG